MPISFESGVHRTIVVESLKSHLLVSIIADVGRRERESVSYCISTFTIRLCAIGVSVESHLAGWLSTSGLQFGRLRWFTAFDLVAINGPLYVLVVEAAAPERLRIARTIVQSFEKPICAVDSTGYVFVFCITVCKELDAGLGVGFPFVI